jgi:uncharacterized coiled-coil protein SlyX
MPQPTTKREPATGRPPQPALADHIVTLEKRLAELTHTVRQLSEAVAGLKAEVEEHRE